MGMFDCMLTEQVKCFYLPCFSDNQLWESGGSLRYYHKNQKVPYRTGWYNYTKNFNILIINSMLSEPEPDVVIVVRNGRLKYVKDLVDTTEKDWEKMERCINKYGEWLRIKTKEDAFDYIDQYIACYLEKINYRSSKMPYSKELDKIGYGFATLSKAEKEKRLKCFDEIKPKVEEERKALSDYMNEFSKKTLAKYEKNVKPERVKYKELLGSYRKAIRILKKANTMRPTEEKTIKALVACQKQYQELLEKKWICI